MIHDKTTTTTRPLPPAVPAQAAFRSYIGAVARTMILAVVAVATTQSISFAQVRNAGYEADYEASGFVAPAGMPSPDAYYSQVEQASFFGPHGSIASQMQTCDGGCGTTGCDGGCDSCGGGSCGCGQGDCGGCGAEGCPSCGGLTNLRFGCLFCRGNGCSVCQSIGRGYLLGALHALLPYGDAGLCAQRWYDFSADAMFLGRTNNTSSAVITTQGINGTPVLRGSDADDSRIKAGMRFSAAFIFGAGGNIEATYLGNNQWGKTATVNSATPTLYSFISRFGAPPQNGFDDTDRSLSQSINTFSTLHSAEVNYRRRTVDQYCRFQGSWLAGIRYVRFDDDFGYSTVGQTNNGVVPPTPRFYNYRNEIDNKLFGPQAGFDVWWNVIAGVNLGFGFKGGWLDNNIDRRTTNQANSLGPLATAGTSIVNDGIRRSTFMSEIEATLLYRISHSWTLKSQYYLLAIDDIAQGFDLSGPTKLGQTPASLLNNPIQTGGLTIQGVSFGGEYVW